jgi:hypothetical protein
MFLSIFSIRSEARLFSLGAMSMENLDVEAGCWPRGGKSRGITSSFGLGVISESWARLREAESLSAAAPGLYIPVMLESGAGLGERRGLVGGVFFDVGALVGAVKVCVGVVELSPLSFLMAAMVRLIGASALTAGIFDEGGDLEGPASTSKGEDALLTFPSW